SGTIGPVRVGRRQVYARLLLTKEPGFFFGGKGPEMEKEPWRRGKNSWRETIRPIGLIFVAAMEKNCLVILNRSLGSLENPTIYT
ncbi:MAG: hypothetical protein QM627_07385, partial [Luteolibacter sp.]